MVIIDNNVLKKCSALNFITLNERRTKIQGSVFVIMTKQNIAYIISVFKTYYILVLKNVQTLSVAAYLHIVQLEIHRLQDK
jgi:hypothetical protein